MTIDEYRKLCELNEGFHFQASQDQITPEDEIRWAEIEKQIDNAPWDWDGDGNIIEKEI